jgi:protein involved in polysaccharide export with SLBB domain
MPRQVVTGTVAAALTIGAFVFAVHSGTAALQEGSKPAPPSGAKSGKETKDTAFPTPEAQIRDDQAKREAAINKMLEAYDLKPRPLPPIPDDPPPHEGAMIGLPYVVEPPDLIVVEVLEALPGRPISGERLVKPDGTINLGFYGDVFVKGLTLEQMKVAIIKHLRTYLTDETLGLMTLDIPRTEDARPDAAKAPFPPAPGAIEPGLNEKERPKPRSSSFQRQPGAHPAPRRSAARPGASAIRVRLAAARGPSALPGSQDEPVQAPGQFNLPLGDRGPVTITIHVDGQKSSGPGQAAMFGPMPQVVEPLGEEEGTWKIVPPEKSDMIFVDISAYNSRRYHVQGDVLVTGQIPCTGNETVLDALEYAGGLMPTAEPKDIRLVRPACGGKPAKVLKVDLEAIQEKGDATSNYQIFPGDRLIVGRNEVVKRTVELDRLNAPIQAVTGTILQEAQMLRALQTATASDRDQLLKEYVDFWAKALGQKGDLKFDEQTLREALIRRMKLMPAPAVP